MHYQLKEAIAHWNYVAPVVKAPTNKKELDQLTKVLDELLDIVGDDENHRLIGLVDAISSLVESYEEESLRAPNVKGVDALKFLMQEHELSQSDLLEIGSQGVVSEVLSGKRLLNLRQIKELAKRFSVDPSTFIDDA